MSDYDMANADKSTLEGPTDAALEPNIERDDTDGGPGSGVEPEVLDAGVPALPDEEPVELDDDLDGMTDDPGDDGNPLLQQNV